MFKCRFLAQTFSCHVNSRRLISADSYGVHGTVLCMQDVLNCDLDAASITRLCLHGLPLYQTLLVILGRTISLKGIPDDRFDRGLLCLEALEISVGRTTEYSMYMSPCGVSWNAGIFNDRSVVKNKVEKSQLTPSPSTTSTSPGCVVPFRPTVIFLPSR